VLGVVAGAFVSSGRQARYQATSKLLFRNDTAPDQSLQSVFGLPTSATAPDPTRTAATNVALVSVDPVADMTAHALGPRVTSSEVKAEISVAAVGQSNVVAITASDPSPGRAATLANTFAQQFIVFRQNTDRALINNALQGVEAQLQKLDPRVRAGSSGAALESRIEQLSALSGLQTGNAEVVQAAKTPPAAAQAAGKLNLAVGGLLGALLGLALTVLLHRIDRRVRSPEEFAEAYGLPVLGVVPRAPELAAGRRRGGKPVDGASNGKKLSAPTADAFRALRARLRYFNADHDVRSLLVTSASPGEGKSTVAWQLARVIALAHKGTVLLVESDLRRPVVARCHGLREAPGLAEVVTQSVPLEAAVQTVDPTAQELHHNGHDGTNGHRDWTATQAFIDYLDVADVPPGAAEDSRRPPRQADDIDLEWIDPKARDAGGPSPRMDVLVAGGVAAHPGDVLESDGMSALIRALEARYDYVVLDAPPGRVVSDTLPLMNQVGGVIIVSSLRHGSRDDAIKLRSQLEQLGAPVLGIVVNNAKHATEMIYADVPRSRLRSVVGGPGGAPPPDEGASGHNGPGFSAN